MKPLKTVQEVIDYLKLFPSDADVYIDMNPVTGGTFEHLVPHPDNASPLEHPRNVAFLSSKGW